MTRVAVATTSQQAADAAARIADEGGNAVDCAVTAALLTMNTEPGVCALAGSAFVTVWEPGSDAITIDGNVVVPGKGRESLDINQAIESLHMEYGGGVETLIGAASIAVPGSLAALDEAVRRYGRANWASIVEPSIVATREGFPLSAACHHYLQYSGSAIFSRSADGFNALHDENGQLLSPGSNIVVPHLAESLEAIAQEGSRIFYEGELARSLVDHVQERGGRMTMEDLSTFRPIVRDAIEVEIAGWRVATNPPPAVGGAVLAAMLLAFRDQPFTAWNEDSLEFLVRVQQAALGYRTDVLELSDDIRADTNNLLATAARGELISRYASASTVHTSAVDENGVACAVTASSGYGSGEMPSATGLWLNNCIGELELNAVGIDAGPPGSRLPSNMAPSAARRENTVLALGSPGADRITTALHQFLVNFTMLDMPLQEAVEQSRLHLDIRGSEPVIAFEPGIDPPPGPIATRAFPEKGMYFGGVGVAMYSPNEGFQVSADPRREGGTFAS